jgi:hypothetical protein
MFSARRRSSGRWEKSILTPVPQIRKPGWHASRGVSTATVPPVIRVPIQGERRRAGENHVADTAVVGWAEKAVAQTEDVAREAPEPDIVEVGQMAREAGKGQPAEGLNGLRVGAAAEPGDGRDASLCGGGDFGGDGGTADRESVERPARPVASSKTDRRFKCMRCHPDAAEAAFHPGLV